MHIFERKSVCGAEEIEKTTPQPKQPRGLDGDGSGVNDDHGQSAEIVEVEGERITRENLSGYLGILGRLAAAGAACIAGAAGGIGAAGIAGEAGGSLVPDFVPRGAAIGNKDYGCGASGSIVPTGGGCEKIGRDILYNHSLCTAVCFGNKADGT